MSDIKGLPILGLDQVVTDSLTEIDQERSDEQLGLYSSWNGINRGMGKYFRFNTITLIASKMGHGKSYALNQLHFDFTDTKTIYNEKKQLVYQGINSDFKFPVYILHFGFEMDSKDEVHRHISRLTGKSHSYLLSSEWNYDNSEYNKITDDEYNMIQNRINYLKGRHIFYVSRAGTVSQMFKTAKDFIADKKKIHENARFIISIDHYLLIRKDFERSDMELVSSVAHLALAFRKEFKAMVIILGQMNNNILDTERMTSPGLQYPNDGDIYMGSQLNWACDNIWIFPYRPELINLPTYGVDKIPTKDLVIASSVKTRRGTIGEVYMQQNLGKARFDEIKDNL